MNANSKKVNGRCAQMLIFARIYNMKLIQKIKLVVFKFSNLNSDSILTILQLFWTGLNSLTYNALQKVNLVFSAVFFSLDLYFQA